MNGREREKGIGEGEERGEREGERERGRKARRVIRPNLYSEVVGVVKNLNELLFAFSQSCDKHWQQ